MGAPDLISGGYFLIKPMRRDAWHPAHLVRDPIISASSCLQDDGLPDFEWFSEKGDRKWLMETPPRIGLTEAEGDRIQAWCAANNRGDSKTDRLRWPDVFASIDALRELVSVIGRVPSGFIAIGIALPLEFVARVCAEENSAYGITEQFQHALVPTPGQHLGWEVLCYNHGSFHSWLCNRLEDDAEKRFGIIPNARGFIEKFEDARTVAEYCDNIQPEPGVWLPWLITQYEIMPSEF